MLFAITKGLSISV